MVFPNSIINSKGVFQVVRIIVDDKSSREIFKVPKDTNPSRPEPTPGYHRNRMHAFPLVLHASYYALASDLTIAPSV
jgi:hypothetical protein